MTSLPDKPRKKEFSDSLLFTIPFGIIIVVVAATLITSLALVWVNESAIAFWVLSFGLIEVLFTILSVWLVLLGLCGILNYEEEGD